MVKVNCYAVIWLNFSEFYDINFSWLRLFSVYGPNDDNEWLIQYLIKEMKQNKIVNTTKGEQFWDYLYVDDISELLMKIKVEEGLGICNLSSNKPIQIKELIFKIKKITKSESEINFGAIPYREDQVMMMNGNNDKLKINATGYQKLILKLVYKNFYHEI